MTPAEREAAEELLEAAARWLVAEGRERIARGERTWRLELHVTAGSGSPLIVGAAVRGQAGDWRSRTVPADSP